MDHVIRVDTPAVTFGQGAIAELGAIAQELSISEAMIMTDAGLSQHPALAEINNGLEQAGIETVLFDQVRVEPTDQSLMAAREAILAAHGVDGIISFGGGSVIDTAKAANLYSTYPAPFLTYVNAPVGEGKPVPGPLKPHIAIPTTCGTGSEATGISVFDYLPMQAKTGIMSRRLLPDHAIVDPDLLASLPPLVLASTALDLLCHALEAMSCRASIERAVPAAPGLRPMTQGANRWSQPVAASAIASFAQNFEGAIQGDAAARGELLWAAYLAGNAFGNAGCHVPHALSYPVSGLVRDYRPQGYPQDEPMVPHGIAVVLNAPSTYRLIGPHAPQLHAEMAGLLGINMTGTPVSDAGEAIAGYFISMMRAAGFPSGLKELGFTSNDVPALVSGAIPQRRLLDNSPRQLDAAAVAGLYEQALAYW